MAAIVNVIFLRILTQVKDRNSGEFVLVGIASRQERHYYFVHEWQAWLNDHSILFHRVLLNTGIYIKTITKKLALVQMKTYLLILSGIIL